MKSEAYNSLKDTRSRTSTRQIFSSESIWWWGAFLSLRANYVDVITAELSVVIVHSVYKLPSEQFVHPPLGPRSLPQIEAETSTETPSYSSGMWPNQELYCVIFMECNKDILPAKNWNIVQSPGNGHCHVYSTMNSWNNNFITTHKLTPLVTWRDKTRIIRLLCFPRRDKTRIPSLLILVYCVSCITVLSTVHCG